MNGSISDMFTQLASDLNNKNILEVVIDQQGRLSFVIRTDGVTHDLVTIQKNRYDNHLIQKYNRAYNPNATNAYMVPASQNRLVPDYNRTQYMDPVCQNVTNQIGGQGIRIKMTRGNRIADYMAADNIIKQYVSDFTRPGNYTWHHLDDLVVDANGDAWCTMQLVERTAHSAAGMRHSGAVAQLEKFYQRIND